MKTNDTSEVQKPSLNVNVQNTTLEEENTFSISQRDTESNVFDNFSLCQRYGQSSIEKAVVLLLIISLISGLILYYNFKTMQKSFRNLICVTSLIDLLLLLIYCFLRFKFNSNQWFNSFPVHFNSYIEYIIILNFIAKVVIFIMSFLYPKSLGCLLLFICKFLLELYLLISCVKLMIFCPGYIIFEEYLEKGILWIKNNLFICCEHEHEVEINDYKKLIYDDTSNYENISNNEIQLT